MTASRDELRAKIFGTKTDTARVAFNGAEVEIRQPTLGEILSIQNASKDDIATATVDMLIKYTYMPDSDIRVFEFADREALLSLPFNKDLQNLSQTMNRLIGGQELDQQVKDQTKSSAE